MEPNTQQRILKCVTRTNWVLFVAATLLGFGLLPPDFARGILFGGLIVTVNFHLLHRTLNKALRPPHIASHNVILAKYYLRFTITGIVILVLISQKWVNPLGLFLGLSVVVASMLLAAACEVKNLLFKEAI